MTRTIAFPSPGTAADPAAWLPIVCPACHLLARAHPAGQHAMAIVCDSCGPYCLSCAAQEMFEAAPSRTDRLSLSQAVQDACLMAECDWPLIDDITAEALLAMAIFRPARRVGRSGPHLAAP